MKYCNGAARPPPRRLLLDTHLHTHDIDAPKFQGTGFIGFGDGVTAGNGGVVNYDVESVKAFDGCLAQCSYLRRFADIGLMIVAAPLGGFEFSVGDVGDDDLCASFLQALTCCGSDS